MKRGKKAKLGGIWPKAIKHTVLSSFAIFTLEKMNRIEKVEGVGEREREMEQSPVSTILRALYAALHWPNDYRKAFPGFGHLSLL